MKRKSFLMLATLLLCLVLGASFSHGGDYYVNSSAGDDDPTNEGKTSTSPWKSITHAVATVHTGSAGNPAIIYVAPGNYDSANNETFPIVLEDYVHLIGSGNSAAGTVIELDSNNGTLTDISLYSALSIEGDGVVVQNLGIKNAFVGIYCSEGGFTIRDNRFADNINYAGIYTEFSNPYQDQSYRYGDFSVIDNVFHRNDSNVSAPYSGVVLGHDIIFDNTTENLSVSLGAVSISGNEFNLSPLSSSQMGVVSAYTNEIMNMAAGNTITAGDVNISGNTFVGGEIGIYTGRLQITDITDTSGGTLGAVNLTSNEFFNQRSKAVYLESPVIQRHKGSGNISNGNLRIEDNTVTNTLGAGLFVIQNRAGYLEGSASITYGGITISDNDVEITGGDPGIEVRITGPEYLGAITGAHSSLVDLGTTTISNNQVTSTEGRALSLSVENFLYQCGSDTRSRLGAVTITGNTLQGISAAYLYFNEFGEDTYGNASAEFDRFTIAGNTLTGTDGDALEIELSGIAGDDSMADSSQVLFPEIVVQNNSLRSSGNNYGINFHSYGAARAIEDTVRVEFGGLQIKDNIFNPDKGAGMNAGILYENHTAGYDISGQAVVRYDPVEISGNTFHTMEGTAIEIRQNRIGSGTGSTTATPSITLPDLLITKNTIDGATRGMLNQYKYITQVAGSITVGSFNFAENILKDIRANGLDVYTEEFSNNVPLTSTMHIGGMTLRDNVLSDGGNEGISLSLETLSGEGIAVAEHTFSGNSISGFEQGVVFDSVVGNTTLRCNTLENNSQYGLRIEGLENGVITLLHNSILNNSTGILLDGLSNAVVDARNNWWGDAAGPAACVSCNKINAGGGSVSFTPWLGSASAAQCGGKFPWTMFLPAIIGVDSH